MSSWLRRRLRSGAHPVAAVLIFSLALPSTQPLHAGAPQAAQNDSPRAALDAGSIDAAIAKANLILAREPTNVSALTVKIAALLARDQRSDAFVAYDVYRQAAGQGSASLLAPIARHELRALTRAELTSTQGEALGALAADGDRAARQQLEQLASSTTISSATISSNEALARLGDVKAAERLVAFAAQVDPGRRAALLGEIATVPNAPALSLVRESLKSTDPMAQATAADAAAALGLKQLQPELQQVVATGHPFAQNGAAVALMQLGDVSSKDRVKTLLTSPAATVRLQAARAFNATGDRSWVNDVRPLLKDQEGLTRFLAAELLLPIDRAASLEVLRAGMVDENPTIRAEATRILTADRQPDIDLLRPLLADETPRVRLLASRAVLEQARKTAAPAASTPARKSSKSHKRK